MHEFLCTSVFCGKEERSACDIYFTLIVQAAVSFTVLLRRALMQKKQYRLYKQIRQKQGTAVSLGTERHSLSSTRSWPLRSTHFLTRSFIDHDVVTTYQ